jgi:hypothetical protein
VLAGEDDVDLLQLPCGLTLRCDSPRDATAASASSSTARQQEKSGNPTADWVLSSLAVVHPDPKALRQGAQPCVSINHELVLSKTWHMKVAFAQMESEAGLKALKAGHTVRQEAKSDRNGTLARLQDLNRKQAEIHVVAASKWKEKTPRVNKTKREMYVAPQRPP